MDMSYVVATTAKWVRDLGYERFSLHGEKRSSRICHWTKWQNNVVLKDKTGRFCDKCHRHRAEKAVSTVRGLAGTYMAVIKDKIPSFAETTQSPMLPWTIRHAARILTRYNVRRDTRMTPYEKIVDRNTEKRDSSIG